MRKLWHRIRRLPRIVLSLNARNLDYIDELNPRRHMPHANNKLLTKQLLEAAQVPTPPTLAVFEHNGDLRQLPAVTQNLPGFAVKPAFGTCGRGILVLRRQPDGALAAPNRHGMRDWSLPQIQEHIHDILAGMYSPEQIHCPAFLEHLLEADETLGSISFRGLPDIRVLVCRGQAVMAMLRLPTRSSGGRANLHRGALGVGLNMRSGRTTQAIAGSKTICRHPDSGAKLIGLQVPHWDAILDMAVRAADCIGLGYVGVDLAIDKHLGPVVVEVNARPGLSIQLANGRGLVRKLARASVSVAPQAKDCAETFRETAPYPADKPCNLDPQGASRTKIERQLPSSIYMPPSKGRILNEHG